MAAWHEQCCTTGVPRATPRQPSGSPWFGFVLVLLSATSCARGAAPDAPNDATASDASRLDAAPHADDAAVVADAAPDAACTIAAGVTPVLGMGDDLAAYPTTQQLAPGAMMGDDATAIAWDHDQLYVTVRSDAFTSAYEPLHVYLETGELGVTTPSQGKEYSGLVAALPFTPNYLVAVRRVSDSGTGGTYDGVYVPASAWSTRSAAVDALVSADQRTLSVTVPWAVLGGCPHAARLVVHVVHAVVGNEWKDLVPSTHTPWLPSGGGYYEIDLTGSTAVTSWTLH